MERSLGGINAITSILHHIPSIPLAQWSQTWRTPSTYHMSTSSISCELHYLKICTGITDLFEDTLSSSNLKWCSPSEPIRVYWYTNLTIMTLTWFTNSCRRVLSWEHETQPTKKRPDPPALRSSTYRLLCLIRWPHIRQPDSPDFKTFPRGLTPL